MATTKTALDAMREYLATCKRLKTQVNVNDTYLHPGTDRQTLDIEVSSAYDGYLSGEVVSFNYDWINKCWGGCYSGTYFNFSTPGAHGYVHFYRGYYPLKKECALVTRMIRMIGRYGLSNCLFAIDVLNDSALQHNGWKY